MFPFGSMACRTGFPVDVLPFAATHGLAMAVATVIVAATWGVLSAVLSPLLRGKVERNSHSPQRPKPRLVVVNSVARA